MHVLRGLSLCCPLSVKTRVFGGQFAVEKRLLRGAGGTDEAPCAEGRGRDARRSARPAITRRVGVRCAGLTHRGVRTAAQDGSDRREPSKSIGPAEFGVIALGGSAFYQRLRV